MRRKAYARQVVRGAATSFVGLVLALSIASSAAAASSARLDIAWNPAVLPDAAVGVSYHVVITAMNGGQYLDVGMASSTTVLPPGIKWAKGDPPGGLGSSSLDLYGTPTKAGAIQFTVCVIGGDGSCAPHQYTLRVGGQKCTTIDDQDLPLLQKGIALSVKAEAAQRNALRLVRSGSLATAKSDLGVALRQGNGAASAYDSVRTPDGNDDVFLGHTTVGDLHGITSFDDDRAESAVEHAQQATTAAARAKFVAEAVDWLNKAITARAKLIAELKKHLC